MALRPWLGFSEDDYRDVERGGAEKGGGVDEDDVPYAAPEGYSVDPEKAALHRKALTYAEQHQVDYIAAVQAVSRQQ